MVNRFLTEIRSLIGKPAPDIFLEAARRIGADPAYCRAFEDGEAGLLSAYTAGMQVVDVRICFVGTLHRHLTDEIESDLVTT